MSSHVPTSPVVHAPGWIRASQVLERVLVVIAYLALAVNVLVPFFHPHPLGGVIIVLVSAAGMLVRRGFPRVALALVALAPILAGATGYGPTGLWSVAVFVSFLLTVRGLSFFVVAVVIGSTNFVSVSLWLGGIDFESPAATVALVCGLLGASFGSAMLTQNRYWLELDGRARDAIETKRVAIDRSVAEERLRIARDLHDVLGHEIAVVSMHLGAAEVQIAPENTEARASLDAARDAVRAVLVETQQVLRVLRVSDETAGSSPAPGLGGIDALIASSRGAGLVVDATLSGLGRPAPPQVSSAAYRIVQESLTNAHRYSDGRVVLRVAVDDEVLVEAINVVPERSASIVTPSGGNGLIGMSERARSAGGYLETSTDGETFRVRAILPLEPEEGP